MTTRLSINAYIKAAALSPLINCLRIRHLRPADTSVTAHLQICIKFGGLFWRVPVWRRRDTTPNKQYHRQRSPRLEAPGSTECHHGLKSFIYSVAPAHREHYTADEIGNNQYTLWYTIKQTDKRETTSLVWQCNTMFYISDTQLSPAVYVGYCGFFVGIYELSYVVLTYRQL